MGENILREHPVLAFLAGGTVSGGTVEPDRTGGGFAGGQTAGQQGRRHTGQHIAAPAPGKPGIAGGVDADAAIRGGDHGPRPFQHHDCVPLSGIPPGDASRSA